MLSWIDIKDLVGNYYHFPIMSTGQCPETKCEVQNQKPGSGQIYKEQR